MCGAIAQLGERKHGMFEVRGSIPLGSTIFILYINKLEEILSMRVLQSEQGKAYQHRLATERKAFRAYSGLTESKGIHKGAEM